MPRTPLTTPAAGNTDWRGWADQLGTEHEALFSDTPGGIDTTTQAKVRANVGASAVVQLTLAAYNALGTKDANTLYVIVG